ncbi:DUF4405 domain-containing protein [Roseomonas sp. 18066]|uniref:DUF4405 domain-containing protein n=1 Tax=Roseomonas sp. 18066 TaxID=2681412 RepID=UPI001358C72F|nr:DUF4405 domain-containing protein [Roseomonas sp. 18066]
MTPSLPRRMLLDLASAGLLVFGLSYWWLGNAAHELAGTAMFLLLILHNVFNRRWWGRLPRARREPRRLLDGAVTLLLLGGMLALLVTSVLISNALSGVLSAFGGFTLRQIHSLAAYWVLVIVAVHLGLRWPMIMAVARGLLGIETASRPRALALRLLAAAVAAQGVWSALVLGLAGRLSMQVSLDWWNFEESVAAFFLHCLAIMGLCVAVTHYGLQGCRRLARQARRPG